MLSFIELITSLLSASIYTIFAFGAAFLNSSKFDKKVMYLLVNEGELSTFGPGSRFGGLVFDTLGFKPVDKYVSKGPHGQNVNNEYINKK